MGDVTDEPITITSDDEDFQSGSENKEDSTNEVDKSANQLQEEGTENKTNGFVNQSNLQSSLELDAVRQSTVIFSCSELTLQDTSKIFTQ